MPVSDKRPLALVTGGATGIGAACCRRLDAAGFRVIIHHYSSASLAESLAADLNDPRLIRADLTSSEAVDRITDEIRGIGEPLAVLVNNAGISVDDPIFNAKLDDFDRIVELNMRGSWYTTKRFSRMMMRQRAGRIVTVSSVVGHTGNPAQCVYGMTKAALCSMTRTLARELAPFGILVNAVAPGFIETAMTASLPETVRERIIGHIPLGRIGEPDEVAEVVAFLATAGSYITGTTIHVNGGMYSG